MISELAFSHRDSNTLACVDEGGNVYIWAIREENGKLEYPFLSIKLKCYHCHGYKNDSNSTYKL